MSSSSDGCGVVSGCVVEEQWHDTIVVLSCSGEVDMLTAPLLEEALAAAQTKQPSAVIFDLGAVDFLASVGMGLLVATQDRLAPEAGLRGRGRRSRH